MDVHRWPAVPNAPNIAPSTARSRSASSRTTMAFLPPSSRLTSRGPVSMAAAATLRPVGTEPVKLTAPTPGCTASAAAGLGVAVHELDQPVGHAALDAGVDERLGAGRACSDGLSTMPLPASSAGKHFHDGMATGKFHGVIIPTTPTGIRVVHASFEPSSDGTVSPHGAAALPGDEAGHVDGLLHVAAGLEPDLPALPAHQLGQLGLAGSEHVADGGDDLGPGRHRHPGPGPLGLVAAATTARSTSSAPCASGRCR